MIQYLEVMNIHDYCSWVPGFWSVAICFCVFVSLFFSGTLGFFSCALVVRSTSRSIRDLTHQQHGTKKLMPGGSRLPIGFIPEPFWGLVRKIIQPHHRCVVHLIVHFCHIWLSEGIPLIWVLAANWYHVLNDIIQLISAPYWLVRLNPLNTHEYPIESQPFDCRCCGFEVYHASTLDGRGNDGGLDAYPQES